MQMAKNLHAYRKSYEKGELSEETIMASPMEQFQLWFIEAEKSGLIDEVNAMTLSTIGADGYPRGRVVLLKEFNAEGFIFYTNYKSEKGVSLAHDNHCCISFFWPPLERQVIIKGKAEKVSEEKSIEYFKSRPRKSQLGAFVSNQSATVASREVLEEQLQELEKTYEGRDIPKPETWGGYLITPTEFEFWQGRRSRLHDRIQYRQHDSKWIINRLQP
jgi:pyridoxamine 5'-phosphate oxidase